MISNTRSMMSAKKHAYSHLGKILILGLGKSGQAMMEYCVPLLGDRVESITAYADKDSDSLKFSSKWADESVSFFFDQNTVKGKFDVGIASPGISEFSPLYQSAKEACTTLIGEVEFAWRESARDSRWVAVTGTNGKTTTTALAAHVLREGGHAARAVGNIGDTCIEAVSQGEVDVFVVEVSSYQLASTDLFDPDVAVLLNITPDHLKWHKTFEAYVAAKRKLFQNLTNKSVAILDATDDQARSIVRELKAAEEEVAPSYMPLGTAGGLDKSMIEACGSKNAAYLEGCDLVIEYRGDRHNVGSAHDMKIKGIHNSTNALAAAGAAVALGVEDHKIRKALASFTPLEHRIEPCGAVGGVSYFNDSKATNTDAVIKALTAFDHSKLILLLGGEDKGTDLEELAQAVNSVKSVICFGAAGLRFFEAISLERERASENQQENPSLFSTQRMAEAFDLANSLAVEGDTILLSPACASFDEFDSFEQRGTAFKGLVKALNEEI